MIKTHNDGKRGASELEESRGEQVEVEGEWESGHLPSVMEGVVNIPMFEYRGKAKEDFFWGVVMPEMGVTIPWVISYKQ